MATPQTILTILYDRVSKFYEPEEQVTGTCFIQSQTSLQEYTGYKLVAEAYMDTVSAIRGNQGRQPLPINQRIYFMKHQVVHTIAGKFSPSEPIKFAFVLRKTEQ